jgi:acetoin utilization deacetylase AcuC-like enzyme
MVGYGTAVMPPVFIEHPSSLEHDTGHHPEQPARILAIRRELEDEGWLGLKRLHSPQAPRAALEAVHPARYLNGLQELCAAGGGQIDLDTVVSEHSYEAALHASGGAIELTRLLLSGEAPYGFSAHRPPGHHATRAQSMGFCLINNVAVAAQHALDHGGVDRVLILDWDVHHGNGTNDIFHASRDVLFISIHESPLYPGTGPASDAGSGSGLGYTVNLPVAGGSGDAVYMSLVEHVVVPLARAFEPQLLLVSAGYDAHREDPLASCTVSEGGYAGMTRILHRLASELEVGLGFVLEGGYALGALARSVAATLQALRTPVAAASDVPVALDSTAARRRLAEWWPALGE